MAKDDKSIPAALLKDLCIALGHAEDAEAAAETSEENRIATLLALKGVYDFLKSVGLTSSALWASTVQDVEEFRSAIDLFKVQDQIRRASCLRLSQDGYCVVEEFIDHGLQPVFEHWFFCKDIRELRVRLTVFGRDRHFRLELLGLWMGSA